MLYGESLYSLEDLECKKSFYVHTVLLNYNFIFTRVDSRNNMINLNPVTCLHGPRLLVAWNIHVSCNLSCITRGIVTSGIAMHGTRI